MNHLTHGFADELVKEAILARVLSALRHPGKKAARKALEERIRTGMKKRVSKPIERGLTKAKVDKAIGKVVQVATKDVPGTPRIVMKKRTAEARKKLGARVGKKAVKTYAANPEAILTLPIPVPGVAEGYIGLKHLAKKGLKVPKG